MIPPQGDPEQTGKRQEYADEEISKIFIDDLFTSDLLDSHTNTNGTYRPAVACPETAWNCTIQGFLHCA